MRHKKLSNEDINSIVNRYNHGLRYEDLAKEDGLAVITIGGVLSRARKEGKYVAKDHVKRFSNGIRAYLDSGNTKLEDQIRKYVFSPIVKKALGFFDIDGVMAPSDGYGRLLDAVFGFTSEHSGFNMGLEELEKILREENISFSRNYRRELGKLIRARLVQRIKTGEYIPLLSVPEKGEIKKVLETLIPKENKVISLYFGLDAYPKNGPEIASMIGVSKASIEQIKKKALDRLRHPTRSRLLEKYLTEEKRREYLEEGEESIELETEMADRIRELEGEVDEYREAIRKTPLVQEILMYGRELAEEERDMIKNLNRDVSEFELSVRINNVFRREGITTIKDLVQKTEREMLKYRNFGRVTLREVKTLLENMSLGFGMDISIYK